MILGIPTAIYYTVLIMLVIGFIVFIACQEELYWKKPVPPERQHRACLHCEWYGLWAQEQCEKFSIVNPTSVKGKIIDKCEHFVPCYYYSYDFKRKVINEYLDDGNSKA